MRTGECFVSLEGLQAYMMKVTCLISLINDVRVNLCLLTRLTLGHMCVCFYSLFALVPDNRVSLEDGLLEPICIESISYLVCLKGLQADMVIVTCLLG